MKKQESSNTRGNSVGRDAFLSSFGTFCIETADRTILGHRCCYQPLAYHDLLFDHLAISFPVQLRAALPIRKSEFLAGRFCAQQILEVLLPETKAINVSIGPNREPIWPKGVTGAISHSANMAVCVATCETDVLGLGVDIEKEISCEDAHDISRHIVGDCEKRLIQSCFGSYNRGLTLVFSAKESFFKAAFQHVGHFFECSAIRLVGIHKNHLLFTVVEELSDRLQVGLQFHVSYKTIGSVVFTVTCLTRQLLGTN